MPRLFDQAGLYTVTGSFDDANPATTDPVVEIHVEVVKARFASNAITTRANPPLLWDNPQIPDDVLIDVDQGVELLALAALPAGGTRFSISTVNAVKSYVLARIDEDGPVLDHATVRGLTAASNDETSVDILETYPDGSRLIGTPLILNRVTPNTRVEISIGVPGVTFEDGSIFKVLTAADFDQFGRAYLKFLWASSAPYSFCHTIRVFEGDKELGTF